MKGSENQFVIFTYSEVVSKWPLTEDVSRVDGCKSSSHRPQTNWENGENQWLQDFRNASHPWCGSDSG